MAIPPPPPPDFIFGLKEHFFRRFPPNLLILTPQLFVNSLSILQRHKHFTGIHTWVETLENIYANYSGTDEAERVKRYIFDTFNNFPMALKYVMIVGDSEIFPIRYVCTDRSSAVAYNTAFYPADLYYADLLDWDGGFEDWDADQDGYYGELRGESQSGPLNIDLVELHPQVAIGRIPASNPQEVQNYVAKVIAYEKNVWATNYNKSALLIVGDWLPEECATMEEIASLSLRHFQVQKAYISGNPCQVTLAPDANLINQAINAGVGLVAYIGHGNPSEWSGVYTVQDLSNLQNNQRPTIAMAVACDTARFTTLPPYMPYTDINGIQHLGTNNGERFTSKPAQPACLQTHIQESMAEAMLVKNQSGAVAYIGYITGAGPFRSDDGQLIVAKPLKYFCRGFSKYEYTLGDIWKNMIENYYQDHLNTIRTQQADITALAEIFAPWAFIMFGDPSLRLNKPVKNVSGGDPLEPLTMNYLWFRATQGDLEAAYELIQNWIRPSTGRYDDEFDFGHQRRILEGLRENYLAKLTAEADTMDKVTLQFKLAELNADAEKLNIARKRLQETIKNKKIS